MAGYISCLKRAEQRADLSVCARGYCSAKAKYKVYPSAYANGHAAKVCKGAIADASGKKKKEEGGRKKKDGGARDLKRWFEEEWVNVCKKDAGGKYAPCGRKEAELQARSYPYCRPLNKLKGTTVVTVSELSAKEKRDMCAKKHSIEPGVDGKPTCVKLDKETKRRKDGR